MNRAPKIEMSLPNELLCVICSYLNILDLQKTKCVNKRLSDIGASAVLQDTRPRLHIARFLHSALGLDHPYLRGIHSQISVSKRVRSAGKGSGLVKEIKRILNNPKWYTFYLCLTYLAYNMFALSRVYNIMKGASKKR